MSPRAHHGLVSCVTLATLLFCGCDSSRSPAPVPCGTDSGAALAACASVERYAADLNTIAQVRPSGSAQWQSVQDLCASRLVELGYQVELQRYATGINVIGQRGSAGSSHVVVSAHYDSTADCPGADDNATGVAALLEVARVLSTAELNGLLTVACWDEEERGMLGSAAYAQRAQAAGAPISASLVFEMLGYKNSSPGSQQLPTGMGLLFPDAVAQVQSNGNRGDFIAVIADESAGATADVFGARAASQGLAAMVAKVPESMKSSSTIDTLRRSDHASFWDAGYPAIMLTDTGEFRNPHYHCAGGTDSPGDLNDAFTASIMRATIDTVASTLGMK